MADQPLSDADGTPNLSDERVDDATSAEIAPEDVASNRGEWMRWSNLWQMPAILISAGLIGFGIYTAFDRPPEITLDDLLDTAADHISESEFDLASTHLEENVKPRLNRATDAERGRFHMILADWVALTQDAHGVDQPENNQHIVEQYQLAVDHGQSLSPAQLERWARAAIGLGKVDEARARLKELEAIAAADAEGGVIERRNRVYRRLVEHALRQPDLSYEALMQTLDAYRADQMLAAEDELWAVARQAEVRLRHDRLDETLDQLLVEMRRLEERQAKQAIALNFGELYVLLGRAYQRLGDDANAEFNFNRGVEQLADAHPARGDALVGLADIAVGQGEFEKAYEMLEIVLRDFVGTRSERPAMLGRAEVLSILGEHERSLEDYASLASSVETDANDRVGIDDVTRSLVDRHDAALATGKLDLALRYIDQAKSLFAPSEPPVEVLFRSASTHRQAADNLLQTADSPDPETRYEANQHYEKAGDDYVRHARAVAGDMNQDDQWADSLWRAGDSYDRAGLYEKAIEHLREYVSGRSNVDPRRAEAMFRFAQATQATGDYAQASQWYEQVIAEHPRSPFATQSFVPLSQCYMAMGQPEQARQDLLHVIRGERSINPDALDYRDALIQLGRVEYEQQLYADAIEHLTTAAERYPNDERIEATCFRLADSHRGLAGQLQNKAETTPTLSPSERSDLLARRRQHLQNAIDWFGRVVEGYAQAPSDRLDHLQQDFERRAHLYRGECAYELGDYERAIAFFDEAARKYSRHHASMLAMVQIVNAYYALNQPELAQKAEHRARIRLEQLPDETFQSADALLDRRAWEQWLANSPPGATQTAAAPDEPTS